MVTRDEILAAIRREAEASGGIPPGQVRFERSTGIGARAWRGRYWARWSDAVSEAGYSPNQWNTATPDEDLVGALAAFIREVGHWPTQDEVDLGRRRGADIPQGRNLAKRLGPRATQIARVHEWSITHPGWDDVAAVVRPLLSSSTPPKMATLAPVIVGYVYLLRHGRHHKIGRSNSTGRRAYEVQLQMPERVEVVHEIATDDPEGIEAYWHRRFASKRTNGEWFNLSADDVTAFKRRSYM